MCTAALRQHACCCCSLCGKLCRFRGSVQPRQVASITLLHEFFCCRLYAEALLVDLQGAAVTDPAPAKKETAAKKQAAKKEQKEPSKK